MIYSRAVMAVNVSHLCLSTLRGNADLLKCLKLAAYVNVQDYLFKECVESSEVRSKNEKVLTKVVEVF